MFELIVKEVSIIYCCDKFCVYEYSVENLYNFKVNVLILFVLIEFVGEDWIEQIVFEEVKGDCKEIIEIDDLIVNYGFVFFFGLIKNWGFEIEKNFIVVKSMMEMNIEGFFVVGDICIYEGKVKLIVSGFGEVLIVVNNVKVYMDLKVCVQFLYFISMFEK